MTASAGQTNAPIPSPSTHRENRHPPARHADVVPINGRRLRPSRLNAAGFCVYCFERACRSQRCIEHHRQADWQLCTHCDGAGFDQAEGRLCNCHGGLEDMTFSVPVVRPRPARLTFAGWCIWCLERWCTSEKCIERHAQSTWGVCDECDGQGVREFDICGCAYGLVEVGPIRSQQ